MAFLRKKMSKAKANLSTLTATKTVSKFHFDVTLTKVDTVPLEQGEEVYVIWRRNQLTGKTSLAEVDSKFEASWDNPQVISVDAKFQHVGKQLATEKNLRLTLIRAKDRSQIGKIVIKLSEMVSVSPEKQFSMLFKNVDKYKSKMPGSIHLMVVPALRSLDGRAVVGVATDRTDESNRREVNGQEYELGDFDEISNSDISELDIDDDDETSAVFTDENVSPMRPSKAGTKREEPSPIPLDPKKDKSVKTSQRAKPVISITPDHGEEFSVEEKSEPPVAERVGVATKGVPASSSPARAVATPSDQETASDLPPLDDLRANVQDLQVDVERNVVLKKDPAVADKKKSPLLIVAPVGVLLLAVIVYFLLL